MNGHLKTLSPTSRLLVLGLLLPLLGACVGREQALELASQLQKSSAASATVIKDIRAAHEAEVEAHKQALDAFLVADHDRRESLREQALTEIEAEYEKQKGLMYRDYATAVAGMQSDVTEAVSDLDTRLQLNGTLREFEIQVRVAEATALEAARRSADGSNAEKLTASQLAAQALGLAAEYNRIQEEAARKFYTGINSEMEKSITALNVARDEHLQELNDKLESAKSAIEEQFEPTTVTVSQPPPDAAGGDGGADVVATDGEQAGTDQVTKTVTGDETQDGNEGTGGGSDTPAKKLHKVAKPLLTSPELLGPEPAVPDSAYDALLNYQEEVGEAADGFEQYLNKNTFLAIVASATDGLLAGLKKGITYTISGEKDPVNFADFKSDGQAIVSTLRDIAKADLQATKEALKEKLEQEAEALEAKIRDEVTDAITDAVKTLPNLTGNGG